MDHFCSSPFWDTDLTWNTTTPIFTSCFLKTAMMWTPIVFFWVFITIEAICISRSKEVQLPWSMLIIAKLIVILVLIIVSTSEIVYYMVRYSYSYDVRPVQYYTPFMLVLTMIAAGVIVFVHRKKGIATSGLFFIFWLLMSVATGAAYYTMLQKTFNHAFLYDAQITTFDYVATSIYFPLSFLQFIMYCFSDRRVKASEFDPKTCPETRASFISHITFWWFNPMIRMGFKKPLTLNDMWDPSPENVCMNIVSRFNVYWLPLMNACTDHFKKVKAAVSRKYSTQVSRMSVDVKKLTDADPVTIVKPEETVPKEVENLSVLGPLVKTFWKDMLITAFMKLVASVITFVNPILLDLLIAFVSSNDPFWKGGLYAVGMFFAAMTESFFNSQYEYRIYVIAMHIRSSVTCVVHKKALVLSSSAKKNFTVGEIVNLMSVDIQRLMDYIQMVNLLWSAPLQIAIAIYLLWQQLGLATLGGLAIMILMIPVNAVISIFIRNQQVGLMKEKDKRTKLMNEILGGIKVLKLYAWELSFQEKVQAIRNLEVDCLKMQAYLMGAITFAFSSIPFLVALASFTTFVLMSSDNVLDANKAFVSLSLFNILRIPTALLPMIVTYTAMFIVSLRRINKFLQSDELDENIVGHDKNEPDRVLVESGTFSWSKDEPPILHDINLNIPDGALVAIVGEVGSGKSSVLSAMLGEMEKLTGRVNIRGSLAYVPQQAWIQHSTLKKNILFIKPFNERKYEAVIEACALKQDLEILPGGDQTEIGEKGINLSGGQKQRVSLARAVYNDSDIYFLDDPLSAVDAHVGKHIFEKVIGPKGMLKRKTRVLVTHRISVLPEVDTVVVMKDGRITEVGSYKELLQKKGAFAEFLLEFLQESAGDLEDISAEELKVIEEIANTVGAPPELKSQISCLSEAGSDTDVERHRSLSFNQSPSAVNGLTRSTSKSVSKRRRSMKPEKEEIKPVAVGTRLTEKEGVEVGSVKWSVYWEYIKSFGCWGCFISVFAMAASSAFSLGNNLWLSYWSNDSLDPANAKDIGLRNLRLGVYGALGAGEVAFTLWTSISLNLACLRASQYLHDGMLTRILRAPMSFFDTTPVGRILNRFSKDIDTADVTIRFNIRMLLVQGFRALTAIIVICLETPIFIAACLPLAVLYYFMQKFYIPTSRQLKRLESVTRSPIYTHFSETITGASCIRAFGAGTQFVERNNELVDTNNSCYYPSLAAARWLAIRLEFIGYCIVFLSALFAVLLRANLDPGIAGLAVSYALQITSILNMLVRATADVETNIVSVERCLEYTRTPTEAEWFDEAHKPPGSWPDKGIIEFGKYSTRYREGLELVLKEISCKITSKERIGIVGRTGAGKSSLTLALFRIIEAAGGKIVIDELNIAKMGLHDLRSKLTIIPQDPVLFTGSLRMNLDPFDIYSDNEVWVALDLAHLKPYVTSLEKGLQHDVSEGGENLSVGQRQLLCLARALLRKTKVLILDEATAAVDVETDEVIQTTIRTAFSDCTVFTIAHRLNTIMDYDRVMVLSKGEIAELDSPQNLLKDQNSIFYSMAKDAGLV